MLVGGKKPQDLESIWDAKEKKLLGVVLEASFPDGERPFTCEVQKKKEGATKYKESKEAFSFGRRSAKESEWPQFFFTTPDESELKIKIYGKHRDKVSGSYELGAIENKVQPETIIGGEFQLPVKATKQKKGAGELADGTIKLRLYYSLQTELRPVGFNTFKYGYKDHLSKFKTGDLIAYSGTGILSALSQVLSGQPWSHLGLVCKLPNKWTNEENLYVVELTRNFNNFQDAFKEVAEPGVNIFRLNERLHQFHGNADIWWVPLKQEIAQPQAMIDWIGKLTARIEEVENVIPFVNNSRVCDFLQSRFKITPTFASMLDAYSSAFVHKALIAGGAATETIEADSAMGVPLANDIINLPCFAKPVRVRSEGEKSSVTQFSAANTSAFQAQLSGQLQHKLTAGGGGSASEYNRAPSVSSPPPVTAAALAAGRGRGSKLPPVALPPPAGRGAGRGAPMGAIAPQNGAPPPAAPGSVQRGPSVGAIPLPGAGRSSSVRLPRTRSEEEMDELQQNDRRKSLPDLGDRPPQLPARDRPSTRSSTDLSGAEFVLPPPPSFLAAAASSDGSAAPGMRPVNLPNRKDRMMQMSLRFSHSKNAMKNMGITEEFNEDKLEQSVAAIVAKMMDKATGIPIADIHWNGTNYTKCFLGCDAVDWMIKNNVSKTREDAVALANEILMAGKLYHITRRMAFVDGMELYKFEGDEETQGKVTGGIGLGEAIPNVFNVTLDDMMARQNSIKPGGAVPFIMEVLIKAVLDQNGKQTEGVFRVPTSLTDLQSLRDQFDNGDYSTGALQDPHLPACLLKLWLRELPEALIPAAYYAHAINCTNKEDRKSIMHALPVYNKNVIERLFDLLIEIATCVEKTKMNIANLAMVFSPCFLRCPATDPLVVMECLPKESMFVRALLEDYAESKGLPRNM
ncbi:Rho GTPase activating protein 39 [Balamuthia mandrillaris]